MRGMHTSRPETIFTEMLSPCQNQTPSFIRALNAFLGIFDSGYEENGSDPDEPHPNTLVNSYVHESD